jgi:hypothetical protein
MDPERSFIKKAGILRSPATLGGSFEKNRNIQNVAFEAADTSLPCFHSGVTFGLNAV